MLNRKSIKSLRVGLINFSDSKGGAARAAYRLHQSLYSTNVDSVMLVGSKTTDHSSVTALSGLGGKFTRHFHKRFDEFPLRFYRSRNKDLPWSLNWVPFPTKAYLDALVVDVVHVHWIGHGFLPTHALGDIQCPVVWTFHDSWAFTGGCHLPFDCVRYRQSCGSCPQLRSHSENDLSRWTWRAKERSWRRSNITVVSPSAWLAECARESSLFKDRRIEVIPNGLDLNVFRPVDRKFARQALGLPPDKKLILFGAIGSTTDTNKGFHLLQPALQQLGSILQDKAEIVIFGATEPKVPLVLGLPAHYIGHLNDDVSLVLAYSAADVFVAPSLSENLPNTIMEAMACGTPSVAFNVGGIPDLIDHKENGYLARPYEPEDLAMGITWVLEDDERWASLSTRTREKVELEFDIRSVAQRYIDVYQSLM